MGRPPANLGDYELGEPLGAGGMGAVYRARHRVTGVEHALKVLPVGLDPELTARFAREGEAQAALGAHPNLVPVHAAGSEAGWMFLAQDLVPGGDLAERLRGGPLPPAEARRLALGIGRGLAHAHARGVLHRDLKPANVLLDADGEPRLMDFGLARFVQEQSSLTESGTVLGSPNWMAPEAALGQPSDARSDVYGLGAILYHCLTGRPPAEGGSLLAVLDLVVTADPPRPRELVPDVPRGLEAVCLRALAKDPSARFESVEALLDAVETGEAPPARAPGLLLGALTLGLVALGIGVATADRSPPEAPPSSAPSRLPPPESPSPTDPKPALGLKRRWSVPLQGSVVGADVLPRSDLLVVCAGSQVVALDLGRGTPRWTHSVQRLTAGPVFAEFARQTWVIAGDAQGVHAWGTTGARRWRAPLHGVRQLLVTRRAPFQGKTFEDELILTRADAVQGIYARVPNQIRWQVRGELPQVFREANGARLLVVQAGTQVRSYYLDLPGQRTLHKLYDTPGAPPAIAELDGQPGAELIIPRPNRLECRSATGQETWQLRRLEGTPRVILGSGPRPEVFAITRTRTVRVAPNGTRTSIDGFLLRGVFPDSGDLIGLRAGKLVRLEPRSLETLSSWTPPDPLESVEVLPGRRLLARAGARRFLLDARLKLLASLDDVTWDRALDMEPLVLLVQRGDPLEAWELTR